MQPIAQTGIADQLVIPVWILMTVAMIVGYIFLVVAIWRAMRAHESIAAIMREIANTLKSKS